MSRSRIVPVLAVAAMLVTAGCAGITASQSPGDTDAQADASQTIRVSASGPVTTQPDQAVVRVAVVATGDGAEEVREAVAANASRMQQALRDAGIDDDQVTTAHYDIARERNRETQRPGQYRAIHAFEVTLANTSRAGEVIDLSVSNGADRVDGVQFTLSEEKRSELREDALRDAMTNARSEADVLAEEANLEVAHADSVETGPVQVQPYRVDYATEAAGASTSVESGPVTVSAQVVVTYNATIA